MKKVLNNIITTGLFLILFTMIFLLAFSKITGDNPSLFGYQLKIVLSGSMEPAIQTGSVIAVQDVSDKTTLETGEVITFIDESERLITHRITDVRTSGDSVLYQTKGDNNDAVDQAMVIDENVVAKYTGFTVPYAGYVVNYAQSDIGSALLFIGPGILLIIYGSFIIWKTIRELDNKSKRPIEEDPAKHSSV
ncbi:signal peptidase I SipW [Saliterribacillus persicus]|uniref:signal peptidase I SipW n=1 Tax=Saliterribacillus persicus TaxID=930114 RepID=UPI001FEB02A0|nr:signal peptidase I [Saliterribacillus persicus]